MDVLRWYRGDTPVFTWAGAGSAAGGVAGLPPLGRGETRGRGAGHCPRN